MTSHQFQKLLVFCDGGLVHADSVAITERFTSRGEDLLVCIDRLAEKGDENHVRRLLVVIESTRVSISGGLGSEEASFGISLSECGLVAGGDAVERHGVRFVRLEQSGVSVGAKEDELRIKQKEGSASGKVKLRQQSPAWQPFAMDDVRSAHLCSPHFTRSRSHRSRPDAYLVHPLQGHRSVCCHDRLILQQPVAAMASFHEPSAEYAEPAESVYTYLSTCETDY